MPRYQDDDDDRPRRKYRREYDDAEDDEITDESAPGNGFAVTSMILGIVGFCIPAICGLLAILFGFLGLNRSKETGTGKGMAIAGIILGILNGVVEPAAIGYGIYWSVKKTRQAAAKIQADIEAESRRWEEENKARQKKWDDDQKEFARKQKEDQQKWEEDQKIAAKKREEDRLKREAENKARQEEFARKQEEDRIKREAESKERAAKFEEERKMREAESKLNAEIATARRQIFELENACRAYTIRNKNKPPATLQALMKPPTGPPLINDKTPLKDPWGQDYQYEPNNKNQVGGLDPLVFTIHPKTGERILAFNRK